MRKLVALLAVLCMVSAASAGITVSGNQLADGVDVGGGLFAYTITLTSDSGAITAVDLSFDGPMNQIKAFGALPTVTMDNVAFLADDAAKDSHFLFTDAQIIPVSKSESDAQLAGVFGLAAAQQASSVAIAQIVVAEGNEVFLTGSAADATGASSPFTATIPVPEPATLGLLAMGVVGLLRKRA